MVLDILANGVLNFKKVLVFHKGSEMGEKVNT